MRSHQPDFSGVGEIFATRMGRRELVKRATILGLSIPAVAGLLAACGGDDDDVPAAATASPVGADPTPTVDDDADPDPTPTEEAAAPDDDPTPTAAAPDDATPTPDDGPDEPSGAAGGTLTVAINGDIATVDPHTSGLIVWGIIKQNVFDQLAYVDPVELTVMPKLATSWEWDDDGTSMTVSLQENVTFHNGEPFTAEDVKSTYDRVRNPDTGSPWAVMISDVEEVEVVDDYTVRFHTAHFSNKLIGALPWIDIISTSRLEQLDQDPVGTGPFRWVEWRTNDLIRIERNEDYWQPDAPLLDEMVFRPITEIETRFAAAESGQVDLVFDIPLETVARVENSQELVVNMGPPVDWLFTAYTNMRQPPFDNQFVRQAFAHAIDRDGFNQAFLGGHAVVTYGVFAEAHWAHHPDLDGMFAYDLEEAARLLEEAGYPNGQGLEFSLMVPSGYPEYSQLSQMIQAAFTELGANVSVDEVELATWAERLLQLREFDVAVDGTRRCAADPAITFSGGYLLPPGPNNICGFMPEMLPEYVELIEAAAESADQDERAQMYRQAQEIFVDFAPGPMIVHKPFANAVRQHVRDFVPHPQYHQDFSRVWLEE